MKLENFFQPKAIAIVGASTDKSKIGRQILDNLVAGGYRGEIYPVNLRAQKIAGRRAFSGLDKIPTSSFKSLLAVIAIPADFVAAEIEKCGLLGIKNIIIISAGFKESGPVGKKREEEIIILAKKYQLNILGPNCLGFINNINSINASFSGRSAAGGRIALLSQSGAIGSAVLDWLKGQGMNIAYFISLGNKAVLDENDFLEYLAEDKNTEAIVFYLEDIQEGERFMSLASRLAAKKPLIVLKAGLSERGKSIAKSHTGALASASDSVRAGLERSGALMIEGLDDLFGLLTIFRSSGAYQLASPNFSIVTNAGGLAVLSADEAARQNLELTDSIDVLGDAGAQEYQAAISHLAAKKKTGAILILLTPQSATRPLEIAQAIISAKKKYPKCFFLTSFLGGETVAAASQLLNSAGIPSFSYPEQAIKALGKLVFRKHLVSSLQPFQLINIKVAVKKSAVKKNNILSPDYLTLFKLLEKNNIPIVKTKKLEDFDGFSTSKNSPVVLKAVGSAFNHKTDKGGIILGIKDKQELHREIIKIKRQHSGAFKDKDNYLVIQPQIKDGLELIIGLKRDPSFGPLLLVGLGGIYAEIFKKTKLVIADLDEKRALKMISDLPFFPILNGARGGKKYNIRQLASILSSLSRLASEYPEIMEFDINPLFLTPKGALAGDVRAVIR